MTRLIVLTLLLSASLFAQNPANYAVYDGKGRASSLDALISSLADADVVFLGEDHDDVIGHQLQMEIFRRVVENYSAKRKVTLSLEMFERDVQVIVNEYLKDQISETHFLRSSRPWDNYKRDYRPLLELAKSKKLEVIAANAPRRYVNMVSRNGIASLAGLTPEAKRWLPPFPIAKPSEAYKAKFKSLLGNTGDARLGLENILVSQSLWDASMAHAVSQSLKKNPRSMVVHLNGWFHTENRLGTVEHLSAYSPKAKSIVVTIKPVSDVKKFEHSDAGDFVVLTSKNGQVTGGVLREVLRRMENRYTGIATVSGKFEQVEVRPDSKVPVESAGRFIYSSDTAVNGRLDVASFGLRTDYTKPESRSLVMRDNTTQFYLPDQRRVAVVRTDEARGISIRQILATPVRNWRTIFRDLVLVSDNAKLKSGESTFHLKVMPIMEARFKSGELWVDSSGFIRQFRFNYANGDFASFIYTT